MISDRLLSGACAITNVNTSNSQQVRARTLYDVSI
jgi:hypothetical protein